MNFLLRYSKIDLFEKETGEIPVRARRREAQKFVVFLTFCRKKGDKPLKILSLRRRNTTAPQSKYFSSKHLIINSCERQLIRKNKIFLGDVNYEKDTN